jgi:cyclic pyranopterin phosphate synthase
MAPARRLTHLDAARRPRMVDVGGKPVTRRTAHAAAVVHFPKDLADLMQEGDIVTAKGSLFQVAILAGIMGAKKTSELVPLCHPIPLEDCRIEIEARPAPGGAADLHVHCRAATSARTGVEMEALTGASVAALALYDMGKAVTHGIVVRELRLLEKTGGKRDYRAK